MDVDRLPEDVFAGEILRRVPLPGLAACRCVCRAWRAAVDRSRLLLVLPRSVRGIFSNYCAHYRPYLFARPSGSSDPPVDASFRSTIPQRQGDSSYTCFPWDSVLDHCNGLILYDYWHRKKLYVCNPATRRCALLPPLPTASSWTPWHGRHPYSGSHYYLAYDPRVSLHYEVFHVSDIRGSHGSEEECWPPPLRRLQVFSSRTQRWEERAFVRQGEPAGTLAQMCSDPVGRNVAMPSIGEEHSMSIAVALLS